MHNVISELQAAGVGEVRIDEPMSRHTTWRIGGPADCLYIPETKEQLLEAMKILRRHEVPWTVFGKGSNTLVTDKGIRGVVIKLGDGFDTAVFDGEVVRAGGAYSFVRLSILAAKQGLTGLEFAGGIPGTVGGAVYMNAGAHGSDVSRILIEAEVVLETGELAVLSREDMDFAYRHSLLQRRKGIVVSAAFQLAYGDRKEIAAAMASYKERRTKTQPLTKRCAGSVFRNPPNDYAARLIEACGLKGTRIGGAEVSDLHANFIVNTGNATAEDVLTLIEYIQVKVHEQHGIRLVPEVLVVGER
ncbi:UDP-N-acetylenolpyruvoylglucosamine reductase [Insulibacter thermoxylanivorax]|uniref:UDP-N-acetylenolpyruvoylglucosamine reductase n=1 Tax=Insulibacter thermoxylanivorax TaxID=2749268 RepID=A0A916QB34_9BACL|nr:UDP-N-acetylmuramate dehydrogenase [Insulibacter thermoxylanivorax]GFR37472.1 UDP-N-acetylenolpyruvoylglucosamine reductase [Insulibacter thermoxylanivorax]